MPAKVDFEKDDLAREHEKINQVHYDANANEQKYHNECGQKDLEKRCIVKYHKGGAGKASDVISEMSQTTVVSLPKRKKVAKKSKHTSLATNDDKSCVSKSTMSRSSKTLSAVEIASKCYDRKVGKKKSCAEDPMWQYGKYCKDECGSGIVAKKFNFLGSRKLWCKTPLSMYQATVGELGRKILCREKVVPRDVRPAPPCNIDHDILPKCGGYYRKYECLRPCEEEHAVIKRGKKEYRNRIDRYWEPCLTKEQKVYLDVNEYAPQNAVLIEKLRRYAVDGGMNIPCW